MLRIIDVHCHCLPGLDDGPADIGEAVELCRMLANDGVETVIATPHQLGSYRGRNLASEIRSAVEQLKQVLPLQGVTLEVLPGADVRVDDDLPLLLDRDEISSVGDARRWVLLEMPSDVCFDISDTLNQLSDRGISAIFTHPERFSWADKVLPQLLRWRNRHGMLMQITAGSLMGSFGHDAELRAWRWLETGLVDLVASDAHNCIARPPRLQEAAEAITARLGAKVAERVLSVVPRRVLGMEKAVTSGGTP